MKPDNWRELVVAEAKTWIGTPYHHAADVKGHGVDCAMILVRVYSDLGLIPKFDPRPYPAQWYLHRDEERYLGWIQKYCQKVEVPQPADIALYRFGRAAAHGAIIISDQLMIHAYQPDRRVETREIRSPMRHGRFDSYWSLV